MCTQCTNSAQQKPPTPVLGVSNCQAPSCLLLPWVEAHASVLVLSYCLCKSLLWLSYRKGSACNHQAPWGPRRTLMALLELAQSDLPVLGRWKVIKRLENYWKFPALHNITFLSSCSQPRLVWSLPAKELLPGQGFLIGFPG